MKAVYLEAGKRPANRTGRRAELLRRIAAAAQRERLLVRVQEVVGGVLGLVGFLLLMGAGGAEEIPAILGLGAAGLGLMWLGAWMGQPNHQQPGEGAAVHPGRRRGKGPAVAAQGREMRMNITHGSGAEMWRT